MLEAHSLVYCRAVHSTTNYLIAAKTFLTTCLLLGEPDSLSYAVYIIIAPLSST